MPRTVVAVKPGGGGEEEESGGGAEEGEGGGGEKGLCDHLTMIWSETAGGPEGGVVAVW